MDAPDQDTFDDDAWSQLRSLLTRFASHHLDQWDAWRVVTPHGDVFIDISRKPAPGSGPDAYRLLAPRD